MSDTPFLESQSADSTEQVIARKVYRILNDKTLDRQQRETLVRRAQHELIGHRRQKEQQHQLLQQVAKLSLPKGFRVQSIQVRSGIVQVGALNQRNSFVWLEAGEAPSGVAANQPSFLLPRPPKGSGSKIRKDAIIERRQAVQARRT